MYHKSDVFVFLLFQCMFNVIATSKDTCGAPFTGTLFEEFHGSHSYEKYEIHKNYLNEDSLAYQVRFRTTGRDGIIAQFTSNLNEEEILLEIIDGNFGIEVISDTEPKPECMFQLDAKVSDGDCYLVEIMTTKTKLTVDLWRQKDKINSTQFKLNQCIVGNFSTFLHLEKGGTEVGSLARHKTVSPRLLLGKPHVFRNFEGCMGDSLVNGVPLKKSAQKIKSEDVDPSCSLKFSTTCTEICPTSYVADKSGKCRCPNDMEISDVGLCKRSCDCIADKCQNGGSCKVVLDNTVTCDCPPGYQGRWCEKKDDPCHDVMCQNGGTCSRAVEPLCTCLPGFSGNRCEIRIDLCSSAPCQNNATCNMIGEIFSCTCTGDYFGEFCENQHSNDDIVMPDWKVVVITVPCGIGVVTLLTILWRIRQNRRRRHEEEEDITDQ